MSNPYAERNQFLLSALMAAGEPLTQENITRRSMQMDAYIIQQAEEYILSHLGRKQKKEFLRLANSGDVNGELKFINANISNVKEWLDSTRNDWADTLMDERRR